MFEWDCTFTYDFSGLRLYERQEIIDPISLPQKIHSSRYSVALTRIPEGKWAEITERHVNGESLRQLARAYGVSHGAIRQIVKNGAIAHEILRRVSAVR